MRDVFSEQWHCASCADVLRRDGRDGVTERVETVQCRGTVLKISALEYNSDLLILGKVSTSVHRTVVNGLCSRVLHEKPTGTKPVKKSPTFYGTRNFITAFASAHHLSLS